MYKAKTGVGCDGIHPKVPLDVTKETRGGIVEFLEKVTTMFFLIPKNAKSEPLIVLMPKLTRCREALIAPEVEKWQQKYRADWDATDGRNGGARQTEWTFLMEVGRFSANAKGEDQGAVALVLDLAKAFESVSLPVVWAWATHFSFPRKISRVLCGFFEHQRRVQFEGCAAEPLRTLTAILPGSSIVLQDALSEGVKIYPPLKLRVFVDGITALLKGRNKEVAEKAKKVMKKLKEEVEKKCLTLSVTENGKEGKSKMIASCGFLENELRQCSKVGGVTMADSVKTLGVDLRRVKKAGSQRRSKEEEVQCEMNGAFQKNYMKVGAKKLLRAGMVPASTWRAHAVEMCPSERLKLRRQVAAANAGKKSTDRKLKSRAKRSLNYDRFERFNSGSK